MHKPAKAIIFAMNGVLIFSRQAQLTSIQSAIQANYGISLFEDDFELLFYGRTDREGFLSFLEKYELPVKGVDKLLADKKIEFIKNYLHLVKPNVSVIEVMKSLAQMQFPIAITTSSTRFELHMTMQSFVLDPYITTTVSADDVKKGKPAVEPFILTAARLNTFPEQCIVIEDSLVGVKSAKAAHCKCIALTNAYDASLLDDADLVKKTLCVNDVLELL